MTGVAVYRYPISVRELPDKSATEISCHVHLISLTVPTGDPAHDERLLVFLAEHRDCRKTMRLPEQSVPSDGGD